VVLSVNPSLLIYDVVVAPQSPIQLLAQLGSLAGTVVVLGKLLMNQLERCGPARTRKSSAAVATEACCARCYSSIRRRMASATSDTELASVQ
jgi:hypothetical protein